MPRAGVVVFAWYASGISYSAASSSSTTYSGCAKHGVRRRRLLARMVRPRPRAPLHSGAAAQSDRRRRAGVIASRHGRRQFPRGLGQLRSDPAGPGLIMSSRSRPPSPPRSRLRLRRTAHPTTCPPKPPAPGSHTVPTTSLSYFPLRRDAWLGRRCWWLSAVRVGRRPLGNPFSFSVLWRRIWRARRPVSKRPWSLTPVALVASARPLTTSRGRLMSISPCRCTSLRDEARRNLVVLRSGGSLNTPSRWAVLWRQAARALSLPSSP